MSEQKACPRCKGFRLVLDQVHNGAGFGYVVTCMGCLLRGGFAELPSEAWRLWNTRSSGGREG